MLSVLLVTYNHSKYIRQALDSVFMQDYDGPIELVIGDDKSSDDTIDIIKEYQNRDTRFTFKFLENEHNFGTTKNYQRCFPACSGEYIAIIEGDDYWTAPDKLTCLATFLNQHRECSMVSHNYFVFLEGEKRFYPRLPIGESFIYHSARDLIADNIIGNFSTCMYRKSELLKLPPRLFDVKSYDWIINIMLGTNALLAFINKPMSVYRVHSNGVWSSATFIEQHQQRLDIIPVYDELTDKHFEKEFINLSAHLEKEIAIRRVTTSIPKSSLRHSLKLVNSLIPPIIKKILVLLLPPAITVSIRKRLS
ncbi:glycosyltransferase [Phytobacter ursingii]|uniref:glycosyltransferase n=1 Tax=Phytobacter ursingii TaxID=1972431 RepID=UPI000CD04FAA|nr:glycosyl transferase [Enterobacteriaceae bacterium ENNIH1]